MKAVSGAKVFAAGNTILTFGVMSFRSTDGGKTWTESGADIRPSTVVAVDENTFFTSGLKRSTDGGESWHSFTNGIVGISIFNLARFKNELYTSTSEGVMKSTDGGESWKDLPLNPGELTLKPVEKVDPLISPKLAIADSVLYGAAATLVPEHKLRICRLSANGNVLVPIQGIPALEGAPSTTDITDWADKTSLLEIFPRAFAVSGETFYAEYMRQLLRWETR